jgi:hypothetical protein
MSGTVDIIAIITPKPGKADRVRSVQYFLLALQHSPIATALYS